MTKQHPSASARPPGRPARRSAPAWLFVSLLRWPSPETTEWFCLRAAAWWVLLLLPGLHLFGANPAFASLRHWGPERTWQAVMGAALAVQIVAVCRGHVWGRVAAMAAFGMIWAFIAGLLWASSSSVWGIPRNTGVGLYSALSADCWIVAIHLVYLWYVDHLSRRPPPPRPAALAQQQPRAQ